MPTPTAAPSLASRIALDLTARIARHANCRSARVASSADSPATRRQFAASSPPVTSPSSARTTASTLSTAWTSSPPLTARVSIGSAASAMPAGRRRMRRFFLAVNTAKKNLRILRLPAGMAEAADPIETRAVSGGLLVQAVDNVDAVVRAEDGDVTGGDDAANWRLVAGESADDATLADLQFAWRAIRAVKSNAILLAKDGAAVGVGMGQVNRVDSCYLAVRRAGAERALDSVAASDAFFPFADGLQILLDAGVRAVVAPGGSIRDDEVIEAAKAAGVTMYFTGTRHFAH